MKQKYWTVIYITSFVIVFLAWVGTTKYRARANEVGGIRLTSYWDLLDLLLYVPVYVGIRFLFESLFKDLIMKKLRQNDPDNFETKKNRIIKEAFNSFWYGFQAILGLFYFANTDKIPRLCFGTLECDEFFRDWPLQTADWRIRSYFMMQMAFHLYTVIDFEIKNRPKKTPEYNEMMLHHLLATFMIILCYLTGLFTYGITILIIADLTDMPLNFSKFCRDMKVFSGKWAIDVLFLVILFSWLYFRGFVITYCVMKGCFTVAYYIYTRKGDWFNPIARQFIHEFFYYYMAKIFMILILVVLNMYWCYLIVTLAVNRIFKKDTQFTNKQWGEKNKDTDPPSANNGKDGKHGADGKKENTKDK